MKKGYHLLTNNILIQKLINQLLQNKSVYSVAAFLCSIIEWRKLFIIKS
ncbi:hypothetical protein ACQPUI_17750 [Clostridium butyricum]